MPTNHPRYMVTDTGELRDMLDLAQERWPDLEDRRKLLLQLASVGAARVAAELDQTNDQVRRERQREALRRSPELIDAELLLSDSAWR